MTFPPELIKAYIILIITVLTSYGICRSIEYHYTVGWDLELPFSLKQLFKRRKRDKQNKLLTPEEKITLSINALIMEKHRIRQGKITKKEKKDLKEIDKSLKVLEKLISKKDIHLKSD